MKEWVKISCLLSICGFAREIRPSDPYLAEFLLGSGRNITQDMISQDAIPMVTYSHLATIVILFLITDLLRYKPLIILMGTCGTIFTSMLLWTTSLIELQIMEILYGVYMSTEVAYYTYIYAKVDREYYPKVTAHTRAAMFLGKLVGGLSAQILLSFNLINYRSLIYITLSTQMFAALWALILPKVDKSLYFHRKNSFDDNKSKVIGQTETINNQSKQNVATPESFKLIWSHFYNPYSNLKVIQWSIWYAISLSGYLQVLFYIQVLWIEIQPNTQLVWNGAVDVLWTALSTLMTLAAGYIHAGRLKPLQSLLVLSVFAALEGGAILLCCRTSNIYVSYIGYILYGGLYAFSITVASAEVARYLEEDSFGLVFGVNTFVALIFQTLLMIFAVSESQFALDTREQFTVYAFYFITTSCMSFIAVAVEYLIGRR